MREDSFREYRHRHAFTIVIAPTLIGRRDPWTTPQRFSTCRVKGAAMKYRGNLANARGTPAAATGILANR